MTAGGMKQKLQIKYAKSIRGLLRRNPTAVSFKHKETFADLKRSMAEKLDGIRGEVDFSCDQRADGQVAEAVSNKAKRYRRSKPSCLRSMSHTF